MKSSNQSLKTIALCSACLALAAYSGKAQLYNVDFGYLDQTDPNAVTSPTMTGAAVLGSAGDVWTPYIGGNFTWGPNNNIAVMDSTGSAAAGVHVDAYNYVTGSDYNPGALPPNPAPLMEDYLASAGSWATPGDGWPIKVDLSGLPTSTAYELVVFAVGQGAGQSSLVNVTDGNGLTGKVCAGLSRDITTGVGDAYQIFNGVTTAGGTIHFEVLMSASNTDGWQGLNGLQLEIVPEPSSLALGVSGLGLLALWRKRFSV